MDKYEEGRKVIEGLNAEFRTLDIDKFNEADTRFRFIDKILTECLNWEPKDINNEDVRDNHYADYKLNLFRPIAVWEAKRTGNYFELPVGIKKIILPLKSICRDNPEIKSALIQVSGYCHERGIQIGVVANGWQIIAFIANRSDSIAPLDGDALVIPSLDVTDDIPLLLPKFDLGSHVILFVPSIMSTCPAPGDPKVLKQFEDEPLFNTTPDVIGLAFRVLTVVLNPAKSH